ncbi:MAG: phosphatidylinositol-specific phospholipase C [Bacilli bacterium]|jgi:1-phosphatidylinositol phosphodiesterase|nr:phosphatidylinositol-specific phospholipase C [Bacilli bacterium]
MEKTSRKHLLIAISLSVVAFLSAAFALLRVPSKKTGNADWMAALPSDRPLSSLSLPGTHDSGATHSLFDSAGKCQDASIREQLDYGARFLDIRLKGVDDSLSLYHGPIDQRLSFASVLSSCYAFLNAHSSETIVMSVKEEQRPSKCTRGFETLLSEAIAEGKADRWYTENAIPTLGEVRGRIVLLSRYANPTMGFDCGGDSWRDNATFEMDNGVPFHIQDRYKVSDNATKWSEAAACLSYADSLSGVSTFVINFMSGYISNGLLPLAAPTARYVNPLVKEHAEEYSFTGIVPFDFLTEDLANAIIGVNA